MGLFSKKKSQQIIKFEQNHCNAKVDDNSVLFVRVSDEVQDKDAMFEVPFTHNAYVIKGGNDGKFYKSGHYNVFETKDEVKDWAKGLSVDIIYMPKDTSVLILWGTPEKIKYRDEASNKVVSVGARGQFGISISNPEQFFRKVVGVKKEFDLDEFKKRFSAAVVDEFADCFLKVVGESKLTYDQFDANRKTIAAKSGKILSEKFDKSWGITLVDFIIEYLGISEEDSNAVEDAAADAKKQEKFKEYLAEIERLNDKEWEREKYLRQLELQDKNAYYEVLKVIGHPNQEGGKTKGSQQKTFCPHCGAEVKANDVFCSKCGKKISSEKLVCSKCGKENDANATFCSGCGNKLK